MPELSLGLDLSNPDVTTAAEIEEFRRQHFDLVGHRQKGNNFWLDNRPDVQKRYRAWSNRLTKEAKGPTFGMLVQYAHEGYTTGVKLIVHGHQRAGYTKEQILDGLAMAFIYLGPRGMDTVVDGLADYEWIVPDQRGAFPPGWEYDPEAFKSGLDYTNPELTPEEVKKLERWYMQVLGEVPGYVRFFARERPQVLKAYRNRIENVLRVLPKQCFPYFLIELGLQASNQAGIREGVLMGKGFGMTRAQVIEAIGHGTFYGGMEAASLAEEAVGDVLAAWK